MRTSCSVTMPLLHALHGATRPPQPSLLCLQDWIRFVFSCSFITFFFFFLSLLKMISYQNVTDELIGFFISAYLIKVKLNIKVINPLDPGDVTML